MELSDQPSYSRGTSRQLRNWSQTLHLVTFVTNGTMAATELNGAPDLNLRIKEHRPSAFYASKDAVDLYAGLVHPRFASARHNS
jgi:hypothetical protein